MNTPARDLFTPPKAAPIKYDLVRHSPSYTARIFDHDKFKALISECASAIAVLQPVLGFDILVGCGHSGTPLVTALSLETDLPMILIRKGECAGDDRMANGMLKPTGRYLIIDDLIESGDTVRACRQAINAATEERGLEPMMPAGILLYEERFDEFYDSDTDPSERVPSFHFSSSEGKVRLVRINREEWCSGPVVPGTPWFPPVNVPVYYSPDATR
jgi:adenine/guanine phosphoribosyltransferase-like PRPP-binding protein